MSTPPTQRHSVRDALLAAVVAWAVLVGFFAVAATLSIAVVAAVEHLTIVGWW